MPVHSVRTLPASPQPNKRLFFILFLSSLISQQLIVYNTLPATPRHSLIGGFQPCSSSSFCPHSAPYSYSWVKVQITLPASIQTHNWGFDPILHPFFGLLQLVTVHSVLYINLPASPNKRILILSYSTSSFCPPSAFVFS
jgi:hypothetical protein